MPKRKPVPLPASLHYLQPFANALAKLPPDELNEDVDASPLESALRKRVRGLDEETAKSQLDKDRDSLELWLKDKPNHPAHWIRGFLLWPDLGASLTQPSVPPPRGPKIIFEPPKGWKVKEAPSRLDLKAGKVAGSIMVLEEAFYEHTIYERQQTSQLKYPGRASTWTIQDVRAGECYGKKFVCTMTSPEPDKQFDYVLRVPGGCVWIRIGPMIGAEFDASPLDSKLHTLRLSAR